MKSITKMVVAVITTFELLFPIFLSTSSVLFDIVSQRHIHFFYWFTSHSRPTRLIMNLNLILNMDSNFGPQLSRVILRYFALM